MIDRQGGNYILFIYQTNELEYSEEQENKPGILKKNKFRFNCMSRKGLVVQLESYLHQIQLS